VFLFFLSTLCPSLALSDSKTTFLPLKINAQDKNELQPQVDQTLAQSLSRQGITMLPRSEAEKLVRYDDSWPPSTKKMMMINEKKGVDYIGIGSLTMIGERISVDVAIFDPLYPDIFHHRSFKEGRSLKELEVIIDGAVTDILTYTRRELIIASVAPAGNKKIDSGAILRKISTRPGDSFSPLALRADLKSIFAMGYFDDVLVSVTDTPAGKAVVFQVREKPVISRVLFSGTDELPEVDVREAVNIKENTIINPTLINLGIERIKALYRSKGYFNAEVTADINHLKEELVEIDFQIEEGEKVSIREISFPGSDSFDDSELKDVIETGTWGWFSWFTESGTLKMDVLEQDTGRLSAFYHNHGFIEVRVGDPVVVEKDGRMAVSFPIEEGPRYRVGTVEVEGDIIESTEELLDMLAIREEEYLNRQVLRDDAMRLTDLYAEKGYAFAEARPAIVKSIIGDWIDVVFKIDKGPLVNFGRVEIRGNTRTRDNVIRRDLSVKEGGVFDSIAIRESNQKLQRLGFFKEVAVTPQPTMQEDVMNVIVDVTEQPTGQFSIGAGYSSSESFMFMGNISEENLMGTGNRLSLAVNMSGISTRFNLSYTNPRFMDSNVSAGISLFNWEKEYDDYTKESVGGGVRFGHPFYEKWRIFYGYSIENAKLSDISPDASRVILDSADINLTSAIHGRLVRDTRNRRIFATDGSRHTFFIQQAGGWLGGDAEYVKLEGTTAWFFPLIWETVFHGKLTAGQVFGDDKKIPVYERFHLGGMSSIRGFGSSEISPPDPVTGEAIGGDKMWYSNLAIQFPLIKDAGLHGEIFTDLGNVYAMEDNWELSDYKHTAGVGFLWMSPMGPIKIAWGYNLDQQEGEDESNWDFTMGGSF
jgi:outer membrane protein insertion porin family